MRSSATRDFLVSHFHLPQPGYPKFLIQLVDPVTRLRIDIFPDSLQAIALAVRREVAAVPVLVLEPAALLDHKLATLARTSAERPDHPKHYEDAVAVAALCGRTVPHTPAAHLRASELSRDVDATCPRCAVSRCDAFPLAPKQAILGILGDVRPQSVLPARPDSNHVWCRCQFPDSTTSAGGPRTGSRTPGERRARRLTSRRRTSHPVSAPGGTLAAA